MKKTLIISDLHHGHSLSNYHLDYELKLMDWIIATVKKEKIKQIINLGDVSDKMMTVNTMVVKMFQEKYEELSSIVDVQYVIAGNHDTYYKNTNKVTALPLFFKSKNDIIIDKDPLKVDNMCFIPWISADNSANIKKFVEANNNKENYLFGHLEQSGFKNGSIISSTDHLYLSEFDKYKQIFSGHYHEKQEINNLMYVGSCYQKNFGEMEHKYIHLVDSNDKITAVENNNRLFEIIVAENGLTVEQMKEMFCDVENKKIRVIIESSDIDYINKVEQIIEMYNPFSVIVMSKSIDSDIDIDQDSVDIASDNELNKMFLDKMEFSEQKTKDAFFSEFQKIWQLSSD